MASFHRCYIKLLFLLLQFNHSCRWQLHQYQSSASSSWDETAVRDRLVSQRDGPAWTFCDAVILTFDLIFIGGRSIMTHYPVPNLATLVSSVRFYRVDRQTE